MRKIKRYRYDIKVTLFYSILYWKEYFLRPSEMIKEMGRLREIFSIDYPDTPIAVTTSVIPEDY